VEKIGPIVGVIGVMGGRSSMWMIISFWIFVVLAVICFIASFSDSELAFPTCLWVIVATVIGLFAPIDSQYTVTKFDYVIMGSTMLVKTKLNNVEETVKSPSQKALLKDVNLIKIKRNKSYFLGWSEWHISVDNF
jgi:hypothetical protein